MKSNRLFILLALLASVKMSAQDAQKANRIVDLSEWQSFYVQYNSMPLEYSINVVDPHFDGLTVGYSKATNIGKTIPLFMEIGVAGQAAFYTDDSDDDWDDKYSLVTVKVPVSLVYKWSVANNVTILPYAGLIAKYHILGKMKSEYTGSSSYYDDDDGRSYSLFDKNDMGGKNSTWNRFQLGYQMGVNVMFNRSWHIGVSYGKDFSEVLKKAKFATTSVTIGMEF